MGNPLWLQDFLTFAVDKGLCTKVRCSTCGARDYRQGLLARLAVETGGPAQPSLDSSNALAVARALAAVTRVAGDRPRMEDAARLTLCDLWARAPELRPELPRLLEGTWAGEVLRDTRTHAAGLLRQRDERVQDAVRRREARRPSPEQLAQRAARKLEIDRKWRERTSPKPGERSGPMSHAPLEPSLMAQYEATDFVAFLAPGRELLLRHGQVHSELDVWSAAQHPGCREWVFITAWNPRSEPLSREVNGEAQERLRNEVRRQGWAFVEGVGRGTGAAASWSEDSLLVFGPSREVARQLGAQFGQNAVLVGRLGEPAAVIPCC